MPWLQNGTAVTNGGNTVSTVTVPSGVTADNYCLFTLGTQAGPASIGSAVASCSNSAAVIKNWFNVADLTNTSLTAYCVTEVVAGDTFTITTTNSATTRMSHFYFSTPLAYLGTLGARVSSSLSTIIPAMTVMPGATMYAYQMSRSATTASSLSSVTNPSVTTMTQLYSNFPGTTSPSVNVNLYELPATLTTSGTTTFVETVATTNAGGFHFVESYGIPMGWV